MSENRLRARAERGEVQIGTWITMIRTAGVNYSSDAAVLRAGYASVVTDIRRGR